MLLLRGRRDEFVEFVGLLEFVELLEFIELLGFVELLSLMESRRSKMRWTFFSTRSSQFGHEENGMHCLKFSTWNQSSTSKVKRITGFIELLGLLGLLGLLSVAALLCCRVADQNLAERIAHGAQRFLNVRCKDQG
jgi:hypothetical protein